MDVRRTETTLARFTLSLLLVYVPAETFVSWSADYGLLNPFYLVDLIAMVLLFWGARRSLRARPRPAPGVLCAAYAWTASNGWRATWGRAFALMEGGRLDYGAAELLVVAVASALSLVCLALSLYLVVRVGTIKE